MTLDVSRVDSGWFEMLTGLRVCLMQSLALKLCLQPSMVFSSVLLAAFGVSHCPERSDSESPDALLDVLRVVPFEGSDGCTLPIGWVNLSTSHYSKFDETPISGSRI
jgi:hypothetical protein